MILYDGLFIYIDCLKSLKTQNYKINIIKVYYIVKT